MNKTVIAPTDPGALIEEARLVLAGKIAAPLAAGGTGQGTQPRQDCSPPMSPREKKRPGGRAMVALRDRQPTRARRTPAHRNAGAAADARCHRPAGSAQPQIRIKKGALARTPPPHIVAPTPAERPRMLTVTVLFCFVILCDTPAEEWY